MYMCDSHFNEFDKLFNAECVADQVADSSFNGIDQEGANISTATDHTTVCAQ
jgi:hypothetical protein